MLAPIWRCTPNLRGDVFVMGLDPEEAAAVFARGWATLDGVRFRPTREGWTGTVQRDGRVGVRFVAVDDVSFVPGADFLARQAASPGLATVAA